MVFYFTLCLSVPSFEIKLVYILNDNNQPIDQICSTLKIKTFEKTNIVVHSVKKLNRLMILMLEIGLLGKYRDSWCKYADAMMHTTFHGKIS